MGGAIATALTVFLAGLAVPASASSGSSDAPTCTAGAHSLGMPGDRLYPDTGNGGYRSLHTEVDTVYDATTNLFLTGNMVQLTDQATQCLSSFSLDFERSSADAVAGPNMTVGSVTVDGVPATFTFVQPTYPGDPVGQDDADPRAHEISQNNPVGGPNQNPLPPACSPELPAPTSPPDVQDGQQCPANKLVITPASPIPDGSSFTVVVGYSGRPGVHADGDGSTEGWFRTADGGFVTTEPVGSEAWMPLNDFPTAKPTYDFYDTVAAGVTAIANGLLVSTSPHPANAQFPGGSVTWHWHSAAPVASYLVENTVGKYSLSQHVSHGITYYEAQDAALSAATQKANLVIMNQQKAITDFESHVSGPYPFSSAGIIVGSTNANFDEETQTMISFGGGHVGTSLLYHENMHQWWGDNVTEASYNMTFYKEGLATLAQDLYTAHRAAVAAGGPGTAPGNAAFKASLVAQFDTLYGNTGDFWDSAPSDPAPSALFSSAATYLRPVAAYLALFQILGSTDFDFALQGIQLTFGGGNIDESELETAFEQWMPNTSIACSQKLSAFFTQWFDTAYPPGGGANRPQITGPGLAGPGFYDQSGGCS